MSCSVLLPVLDYLDGLAVPMADSVQNLRTETGVEQVLTALASSGTVTRVEVAQARGAADHREATARRDLLSQFDQHVFQLGAICRVALVLGPDPHRRAQRENFLGHLSVRLASTSSGRRLIGFVICSSSTSYFRRSRSTARIFSGRWSRPIPIGRAVLMDPEFDIEATLRGRRPLTLRPSPLRPSSSPMASSRTSSPITGDGEIDKQALTKEALAYGKQLLAQHGSPRPSRCRRCFSRRRCNWPTIRACWRPVPIVHSSGPLAFEKELSEILAAIELIGRIASTDFTAQLQASRHE